MFSEEPVVTDSVNDSRLFVGDIVQVRMPRGHNKRGVWGINPTFTTLPEAKFDGAVGKVVEVVPRGSYTIPQYLVDFRNSGNKAAIPWQAQWFREEWLQRVPEKART